jgi:hypothetical protein
MRPPDRDLLGLLPEDDCPGSIMLLAAGRIPVLPGETSLRRSYAGMFLVSTTGGAPGWLYFLREMQIPDVFCHRPPIAVFGKAFLSGGG